MRNEVIAVLDAIRAYNVSHEGDSDDAEIDAAFEMEDAALRLVQRVAMADPEVARELANFEAKGGVSGCE